MLKCCKERCVCAPQSLSSGTSTTPRLSVSFLTLFMRSTPTQDSSRGVVERNLGCTARDLPQGAGAACAQWSCSHCGQLNLAPDQSTPVAHPARYACAYL